MSVRAVVLDNAAAAKANDDGAFDLMLGSAGYGAGGFYFDNQFDCARLKTNRVRTGFCEPGLDEQMAAAWAESDPALRQDKVGEVNKRLTEEFVPWVPLFGGAEVWAMQPYVEGFVGSSIGQMVDLWKVTIDK
jgi:ABC-type transport system substrate-binding protein